jgi:hypothetical protein
MCRFISLLSFEEPKMLISVARLSAGMRLTAVDAAFDHKFAHNATARFYRLAITMSTSDN